MADRVVSEIDHHSPQMRDLQDFIQKKKKKKKKKKEVQTNLTQNKNQGIYIGVLKQIQKVSLTHILSFPKVCCNLRYFLLITFQYIINKYHIQA